MKTPFKMKTPLYRAASPLNNNSTGRYPKTHGEMGEKELKDHGMVNHTAPSPKAKKDKPKAKKVTPLKKAASCWEGYKAEGKKKSPSGKKTSGGSTKMVNNCVKI